MNDKNETMFILISEPMKKIIRQINFSPSKNEYSTEYPITKLLLAPFALTSDFECIGRILGATICYFEGYSSDDLISGIEVSTTPSGSYVARSQLTLVPYGSHIPSKGKDNKQSIGKSKKGISHVSITSVIEPRGSKTTLGLLGPLGVQEVNQAIERMFYTTHSSGSAKELMGIYRATGISVPQSVFNVFLNNLRNVDARLAEQYEKEFEFELDFTQQIISSWRSSAKNTNAPPVCRREVKQMSRLEKKLLYFHYYSTDLTDERSVLHQNLLPKLNDQLR
eukprot:gene12967-8823_t